ncbi:MAG: bifunctional hydroxymethylpyrimidine kinase/phosphomethylpyrimidine kinase [Polyangiaceae bacterium]|nr:bifunctional hydroxymethylpyrimidine kinase/phosphomethylpyrimidine kinase [Polyangiaceae bacterium]
MLGRVLVVAGSDSGGGAGIQADIKTVTALGGYAMTAITALTAQNTMGVFGVLPIEPSFVEKQMSVVLEDLGADVIKTGMLHDAAIVHAVAKRIRAAEPRPKLVVDPVMVAKGGATLLKDAARDALVNELFPLADVVTPNAPEAAALTSIPVESVADLTKAGTRILAMGARAAYMKGGHLPGEEVVDVIVRKDGPEIVLRGPRIETRSTHGTGCTLASALAASLAQGMDLESAARRAREYVAKAIESAPGFGSGHGPLDHGWPLFDGTPLAPRGGTGG